MPLSTVEMLEREMMAAGNRLILALSVENDFGELQAEDHGEAIRKQWSECRVIVEQFAEDYSQAIDRWRDSYFGVDPLNACQNRTCGEHSDTGGGQ